MGIYAILVLFIVVGVFFKDMGNIEIYLSFCIFILLILLCLHSFSVGVSSFTKQKYAKGILFSLPLVIFVVFIFIIPDRGCPSEPKWEQCKSDLRGVQSSLEMYYTAHKAYPVNLESLIKESYLSEKGNIDPWGNKLNYSIVSKNENYLLGSSGPDGKPNTEDDIDPPINTARHSFKAQNENIFNSTNTNSVVSLFYDKAFFEEKDPVTNAKNKVVIKKELSGNVTGSKEKERVLLLLETNGSCNACTEIAVVAIIGNGIKWKHRYGYNGCSRVADIEFVKILKKDQNPSIAVYYDEQPPWGGNTFRYVTLFKWNGKDFVDIWSHIENILNHGNRGGDRGNFKARIEFKSDNNAILVDSEEHFITDKNEEEYENTIHEEYIWSDGEWKFVLKNKKEDRKILKPGKITK